MAMGSTTEKAKRVAPLLVIALLAGCLVLSGCGGDETVAPPSPSSDTDEDDGDSPDDTGTPDVVTANDGEDTADDILQISDVEADEDLGLDTEDIEAPVLCTEEDDSYCADELLPNICQVAVCLEDGSCVLEPSPMESCCVSDAECDDGDITTFDQCQGGPLGCHSTPDPLHCPEETVLLSSSFADGTMQGWTVLDGDGDPFVGWKVMANRSHQDAFAFAFRQTACPTYDTRAYAPDCELTIPGPGPKAQEGTLISPPITLPSEGTSLLSFYLFAELELVTNPSKPCADFPSVPDCFTPAIEALFDQLELELVTAGSDGTIGPTTTLWSVVELVSGADTDTKGTGGSFMHLAADLSAWAGETVRIRFRVSTDDSTAYEGVYLDSVLVRTACPDAGCGGQDDCITPNTCQSNECTSLLSSEEGYCFGRLTFPNCIPCPGGTGLECEDGDVCTSDFCGPDQTCLHEATGVCCEESLIGSLFHFESGELPVGWEVAGGYGLVKWHVTDIDAKDGDFHLYFGNPLTGHYDMSSRVFSSLTTGFIEIPATSLSTSATFDLKLSTQYEDLPFLEEAPKWDRLLIQVLDPKNGDASITTVFDSLDPPLLGATGNKSGAGTAVYEYHGMDLTPWQGQSIRLRFFFDTLDAGLNTYGGVFIDNFALSTGCAAQGCSSDNACDDEYSCSVDACVGEACTNVTPNALCCEKAKDCDDANPCTSHSCEDGACVLLPAEDASCCAPGVSHEMNFEGDSPGWKFLPEGEGLHWNIINAPVAYDGTGSLYFGDPTTGIYAKAGTSGESAQVVAPPLVVAENGTTSLSFRVRQSMGKYHEIPGASDLVRAYILTENNDEIEVWNGNTIPSDTGDTYLLAETDLSPWAGDTIQVAFEAVTSGKTADAPGGAWIDAITLTVECPESAP